MNLGTCAVLDCTNRATGYVYVGYGDAAQPVAVVCDDHERANTESGWRLRTAAGRLPVLYPPGVEMPPFPEV